MTGRPRPQTHQKRLPRNPKKQCANSHRQSYRDYRKERVPQPEHKAPGARSLPPSPSRFPLPAQRARIRLDHARPRQTRAAPKATAVDILRIAIFLAASAGILRLSWRSRSDPHSHGFYRFFAFELLAALILWNAPVWFRHALGLRQLVSWTLGAISAALAAEAFRLLRKIGKPASVSRSNTNLSFENTTALVTTGAYRWIRHPMYASLLALTACAYLKNPFSKASVFLAFGAAAFLFATARVEEQENLKHFGATYAGYMKRTTRFVPFVL